VQARKDAREAQNSVKHTEKSAPTLNKAPVKSARSSEGICAEGVHPELKTVTSRGRAVKLPAKLSD
jgi:hypothetical protein